MAWGLTTMAMYGGLLRTAMKGEAKVLSLADGVVGFSTLDEGCQ